MLSLVDACCAACRLSVKTIWDEEEKTLLVLRNQRRKYEKSPVAPDSHRHRRLPMMNRWKLLLTTSAFSLCEPLNLVPSCSRGAGVFLFSWVWMVTLCCSRFLSRKHKKNAVAVFFFFYFKSMMHVRGCSCSSALGHACV